MRLPRLPRPKARHVGGVLFGAGLALLLVRARFAPALGVEMIAAGFWWWARATDEPALHVPRWAWLRRPAAALWLAAALDAALPGPGESVAPVAMLGFWWQVQAVLVVWAALELLAALPFARPFSDLPGPLVARGFWLPALLPSAGFVLLWRHADVWVNVERVRDLAALLLLITGSLAAVRAFGRRRWTAGLRWLVVWDGSLAGVLLATHAVPVPVTALLWVGACGTHTWLLVAELGGATPRRGPVMATLWRATAWTTSTALAWPLLVWGAGGGPGRGTLVLVLGAFSTALATWVAVARMPEAPERRTLARPGSGLSPSRIVPAFVLAGAPVAIASAWTLGYKPGWLPALVALVPALAGGGAALLTFRPAPLPQPGPWARAGQWARRAARRFFRIVIASERALLGAAGGLLRALSTPLRDLHTGDAQEYLLFLAGVAVLAGLLPLLR